MNKKADGKLGLPEGLPEPEPEYSTIWDDDDDLEEQQVDDEPLLFTDEDHKDFPNLERQVSGALRDAAVAIREIRSRKLWKMLKDESGEQLYPNFDQYCAERLGHTRQWVTHLTNWLRVLEALDELDMPIPLSIKAAQGLLTHKLERAGGLKAVLEEAQKDGVSLDRDHLREIVDRRTEFGSGQFAAKTYDDYRHDVEALQQLGVGETSWDIVQRAKNSEGDFADNLISLCRKEKKLPRGVQLVAELSGSALDDVVSQLKEVAEEQAALDAKKVALAAKKMEIKATRQQAKALEQELKAKETFGEEESEEVVENLENEVCTCLHCALESLDEVLVTRLPDDESELNSILATAQECGDKLAEITAKVKEILAGKLIAVGDE